MQAFSQSGNAVEIWACSVTECLMYTENRDLCIIFIVAVFCLAAIAILF